MQINNKKKIKTIFLFDLAIKHLWGRRCAIGESPDYSHSPQVKNCRNVDFRKIKGQKPCLRAENMSAPMEKGHVDFLSVFVAFLEVI